MKTSIQFTNREEELMDFFWAYGKPATSNEILDNCKNRTWSESYLYVMLRSLQKKGAIEPGGLVRYGTQYARQFECSISKEAYYVQLALEHGVDKAVFARVALSLAAKSKPEEKAEWLHTLKGIIRELEDTCED